MAEQVDAMDSKSIVLKEREGSNPSLPTIIRIKNIRLGFATNSSSTHSIVLVGTKNSYREFLSIPEIRIENFLRKYFSTTGNSFVLKDSTSKKYSGKRLKFDVSEDQHIYDKLNKFLYFSLSFYNDIKNITKSNKVAAEFILQLYNNIFSGESDLFENIKREILSETDYIIENKDHSSIIRECTFGNYDKAYHDYIVENVKETNNIANELFSSNEFKEKFFQNLYKDFKIQTYSLPWCDINDKKDKQDYMLFISDLISFLSSDYTLLYSYEYDASCPNNKEIFEKARFKLKKPKEINDLEYILIDSVNYKLKKKNTSSYEKEIVSRRIPILLNEKEKPFRLKREVLPNGEVDYVLFNKINGSKIRFSLDLNFWRKYCEKLNETGDIILKGDGSDYDQNQSEEIKTEKISETKAVFPELVDLKITDYCPFGCEFCYQSSTKNGVHAPLERIKKYIDILYDLRVFEIALGGGEPTMHPDFSSIVEYIRKKNMIVNFTTYSTKWLKNEHILENVSKYVSGIGVSVHSLKDTEKSEKIIKAIEKTKDRFSVSQFTRVVLQHVFGSVNLDEFNNILKYSSEHGYPLLLLGPKRTGFGKNYNFYNPEEYLFLLKLNLQNFTGGKRKKSFMGDSNPDFLYELQVDFTLSVDTAFAKNFDEFLRKELNVNNILYSTREGLHSFYIDAVKGKMARSSYVENDEYVDIPGETIEYENLRDLIYKTYLSY